MGFRYFEFIRAAWGVALLAAPRTVLTQVRGARIGQKALVVTRILGIRHLAQACLSGVHPTPEILAAGVWVDLVHSMTALGLAAVDRRHVRAAMADSVVAAAWSAAGFYDLRTGKVRSDGHARLRDRMARSVFNVLPGGRLLMDQARRARAEHDIAPSSGRA